MDTVEREGCEAWREARQLASCRGSVYREEDVR